MKTLSEENKRFFNMYFNEEGEQQDPNQQQQDPNQQQQDPNGQQLPPGDPNAVPQQQAPPAFLPKAEFDEDDEFEQDFPMDNDNTNPEQDVINFTNFQRLSYFKKFQRLVSLTERIENQFNSFKDYTQFDDVNDEKQQNIINVLLASVKDIRSQIRFFLEKGIIGMNIDKIQVIFRSQVRKINFIIDQFEMVIGQIKTDKK